MVAPTFAQIIATLNKLATAGSPELPKHFIKSTGVHVTRCDSWDEFIQALRHIASKEHAQRVFRGHANPDWKLSSTWEREIASYPNTKHPFSRSKLYSKFGESADGEYERKRDEGLYRFKRLARTMPEIPAHSLSSDNDWWAFARHYGLDTPLLDWSRSPFIAAFWAFAKRVPSEKGNMDKIFHYHSDQPVVVWELAYFEDDPVAAKGRAVFSNNEFDLIDNSRYDLHRQRAQQGVFTRLEHDAYADVESYLSSKGLGYFLERYEIPCSSRHELSIALSDLERMNIHYGTVFPDPQGAAMQTRMEPYWRMFRTSGGGDPPLWGCAPTVDS